MAMNIRSEMSCAELEIRKALERTPGTALHNLMEAYNSRPALEKEVFVAALVGHLVSARAAQTGSSQALAHRV